MAMGAVWAMDVIVVEGGIVVVGHGGRAGRTGDGGWGDRVGHGRVAVEGNRQGDYGVSGFIALEEYGLVGSEEELTRVEQW